MTLKKKLVANRMSAAFILLISILASTSPTVFLGEDKFLIIPLLLVSLLISWLVYSSIAKERLIGDGELPGDGRDYIDNFIWHFKSNSKIKILFGVGGLSGGILIVLSLILFMISPELLEIVFFSFYGYALTFSLVVVSYFIVKRRLR